MLPNGDAGHTDDRKHRDKGIKELVIQGYIYPFYVLFYIFDAALTWAWLHGSASPTDRASIMRNYIYISPTSLSTIS
jgi:hypothetical protein